MIEIGFVLLTHANPAQALRLVDVLNRMFDRPQIACHHDFSQYPLSMDLFPLNVRFVQPHIETQWGDIKVVKAGLAAMELLRSSDRPPDWIYLLSAADYPVQPADVMIRDLLRAECDAYLDYRLITYETMRAPAKPGGSGFDDPQYLRTAYNRYCAERIALPSIRSPWKLPREGPIYLKHPKLLRRASFFSAQFQCYAGEHWFTANAKCVDYFLSNQPLHLALFRHLAKRIHADECAYHSMLGNAPQIRACKTNLRYVDWSNDHKATGHPKELTLCDLEKAQASGAHFARKLNVNSPFLEDFSTSLGI
jgi:hypothetical protein